MTSEEYFDHGYALMLYGIDPLTSYWLFRGEEFKTPFGKPGYSSVGGLAVARIEDVRANS